MEEAAEGHFTTEAQQWNQDEQTPTVSGQVIFTLRPKIPYLSDWTLPFSKPAWILQIWIRMNHQTGEWGRGGNPWARLGS